MSPTLRVAVGAAVLLCCARTGAGFTEGEERAIKAMYSVDNVHGEGDMLPADGGRGHNSGTRKWPNGIVYYTISNRFSNSERDIINRAMRHIEQHTCVRFEQRNNQNNYIRVHNDKSGCFATIGMSNWRGQDVNLAYDCINYGKIGTAVHELLHSLGFMHEHKRPDRDQYVQVLEQNIKWDANGWFKAQFARNAWGITDTSGTAYDTQSIMQYPPRLFSGNGRDTLRSLTGASLGQFDGLTPTDVYEVNKVYGCDMANVPTDGVKFDGGNGGGNSNNNNNNNNNSWCKDKDSECSYWASIGECRKNANWMGRNCAKSCNKC